MQDTDVMKNVISPNEKQLELFLEFIKVDYDLLKKQIIKDLLNELRFKHKKKIFFGLCHTTNSIIKQMKLIYGITLRIYVKNVMI